MLKGQAKYDDNSKLSTTCTNWKYLQRLPKKFRDKFAPVGTKVEKIEKWNNTENWNIPNYS